MQGKEVDAHLHSRQMLVEDDLQLASAAAQQMSHAS
jgi:hypothetical protein